MTPQAPLELLLLCVQTQQQLPETELLDNGDEEQQLKLLTLLLLVAVPPQPHHSGGQRSGQKRFGLPLGGGRGARSKQGSPGRSSRESGRLSRFGNLSIPAP